MAKKWAPKKNFRYHPTRSGFNTRAPRKVGVLTLVTPAPRGRKVGVLAFSCFFVAEKTATWAGISRDLVFITGFTLGETHDAL